MGREFLREDVLGLVRERTVPLVVSEADGRTIDTLGSGVPVWIRDQIWVVTARHVLERVTGSRFLSLPLSRGGVFRVAVHQSWAHANAEVDVAAIRLNDGDKETLLADKYVPVNLQRSLEFSRKKIFEPTSAAQGTGMMAFGGYPGELATTANRTLNVGFLGGNTTIAGFGRATPFPYRELDEELQWLPIWLPWAEKEKLGDWSNAATPEPSLSGLSGSGIWWLFREGEDVRCMLVSIFKGRLEMPSEHGELFCVTHRVEALSGLINSCA